MGAVMARNRWEGYLLLVACAIGSGQAASGATASSPGPTPGGLRPDQAWSEVSVLLEAYWESSQFHCGPVRASFGGVTQAPRALRPFSKAPHDLDRPFR